MHKLDKPGTIHYGRSRPFIITSVKNLTITNIKIDGPYQPWPTTDGNFGLISRPLPTDAQLLASIADCKQRCQKWLTANGF